jgi:dTMP kinase
MLIAIEGIDGSGKGTQAGLLLDRARREGATAELLAFPMYEQSFFGAEIGRYLNGEFGDVWSVHPRLAATLYAGDRFENRERLWRLRGELDLVICDRYTPSNQAHQSVKLPEHERPAFFAWLDALEHEVFGIPRPDLVVFLDLPPEVAAALIQRKSARSYTEQKADIHEVDAEYLRSVHTAYHQLSQRPGWVTISCMAGGGVRPLPEIHEEIWAEIERAGAIGAIPG